MINKSMKKIAIINQRYGLEVNGGSEAYTRLLAEHLQTHFDVTVLTTCALDYDTWENYYPAGTDSIHGVRVLRFPVRHKRRLLWFRLATKATSLLKKIGIHTDKQWVHAQGPVVPALIRYIKEKEADYDIFLFVTYLYYTTVFGLPQVAGKSILIPTAHDEPYIHFPIYKKIFAQTAGILYLTEEEKTFVEHKFQNAHLPHDVIGVGIDFAEKMQNPDTVHAAIEKFRTKYHISGNYIIYAGRVDTGKNCEEMFEFFLRYKREHPNSSIRLVIVGKAFMEIPRNADITHLGFVCEADKFAAIAGAKWIWMPSVFESLSIALLEGLALGVPGLVNGACEVLQGHCDRSGGALSYRGYEQFCRQMVKMEEMVRTDDMAERIGRKGREDGEYKVMSDRARAYVETNYRWEMVEEKVCRMIDSL